MKGCEFEECQEPHYGRGYCKKHYDQQSHRGLIQPLTPATRFWAKVDRSAGDNGCWPWLAHTNADGYGCVRFGKSMTLAHRAAYAYSGLHVPEGFELDHLCRNRACVNPTHLEPVTHAENMRRSATARKTHCKRGHLLAGDNLYASSRGDRRCKPCNRAWVADRKESA